MISIKDVAQKAGVSRSTVSNVFNNRTNVSKEVREHVLDVAKQLDYVPNKIASSLALKRTNIVGYFMEKTKGFREFNYQILDTIALKLSEKEIRVLLYRNDYTKDDYTNLILNKEPIDGAIISAPTLNDLRVMDMVKMDLPIILIGKPDCKFQNVNYVDVNNFEIAKIATDMLLEKQHLKIAVINDSPKLTISIDRINGIKESIKNGDLENVKLNVFACDNTLETGYEIAKDIINNYDVTAIITESDVVASGVYKAIKEAGLKIPEDYSIISLGGHSYRLEPALYTVEINNKFLAEKATENLINMLDKKPFEGSKIYNCFSFIQGDSLGYPKVK